jgi:two-component system, NtrC family, response regulator AtoC
LIPFKIFIVEDDIWYSSLLEYHLSLNPDYEVIKYSTGKQCLANLHQGPSVITLDYSLPDLTGEEILRQIKKTSPDTAVVIISGQEDISTAIRMLKEGAYDYIVKDEDAKDRIWNTVKNIRENLLLKTELSQLKQEVVRKYKYDELILGHSDAIKKVFHLIEKATGSNITVSITGETGTGKELVAKAIHYNSASKEKPFVAVNVSAIPKDLMESELFGHEKGAFTGAVARRTGKFEEAHKGTLFLDEIGEMDLSMQAKLLRVLQEKEVCRVGSNTTVKIDTRIIIATHKNLAEEVKKGAFREDLYYRLLGLSICVPPLRERGSDIILLAKAFVESFCKENKAAGLSLSLAAQTKLLKYHFPGNVRELKAIVELACVMTNTSVVEAEHIEYRSSAASFDNLAEESTLKEYTRKIIDAYLKKYQGDVMLVARKLDIGKSTIYNHLKEQST